MLKMFTPKTVVNFEGLLMRKIRFLRKNVRFTDQKSKTRYFSTGFCFTICFSILEKHLNGEYMALLWNVGNFGNHDYPFNITYFTSFKMRLSNAVFCVRGQKKRLLRKFVPKTRLKNSWLSQSIIRFSLFSHELLQT